MSFLDEAVIVCTQYDDFLKVTLPFTLRQVKKVIVVTSDQPYDDGIRHHCRYMGVHCLSTDIMHRFNAPFAKGLAINRGLDLCSKSGWLVHMDADIVLPDQTSLVLSRLELDKKCLYGIDRVACPNALAFKDYLNKNTPQYNNTCLVEPPRNFPLMARWIHPTDGWLPIGFFQMWHGSIARTPFDMRYPEDSNDAIRTDIQHALQWDGKNRRLIPDVIAIHLDSCSAPVGANWTGRTTPRFDMNATEAPSNAGVKSYYDPTHPRFQSKEERGPDNMAAPPLKKSNVMAS